MGPATVRMHMAAFEAAGRDWWRATIQTASNLKLFPGLAELTQRETEVLEIRRVSALNVSKRQAFNVGKTLPWCRVPTDKVPCLSSNARIYLTHRRRLAIGVELLRCNGIYLREDDARFLMREVGNSVLVNLAGNSFEMYSFISVFCMLLTVRALCAKRSFFMPNWLLFHPRSICGALYGLMTNLHRARTQTGASVASSVPSELGSYFFSKWDYV